ncbi:MAG: VWA domain-containing protein [Terracidiphilus sp.]
MTTINAGRYITLAILFLLAGCSHRTPDATVEVIDTSASITPRAEKAALDAVENQIARMRRGDTLILIPITSDAENDAGGRILRLSAPTERETYDNDLRRFQKQGRKQFAAWVASLDPHQSRTDILGALDAARQELAALPKGVNRRLIVVSDFLEDEGTYNFVSNNLLANATSARQLAARLREQHGFRLQGVSLCLGRLESSDFAPLSARRKAAVQAFWTAYFATGDQPAEIQLDDAEILADTGRGCFGGKP